MTEPRNTPRGTMTKARRLRAFERHGGVCVICRLKIDGVREKWIVEHLTPLSMGGADDDNNTGPAHERCAKDKTAAEAPIRAKTLRQRQKHLGIRSTSRPMPGSKASGWRKPFGGGPAVRREP